MESNFIKSVNLFEYSGTNYHDEKEYVSASGLKKLKVSPAHFREEEEVAETEAMLFGSAYHCYILEPERFNQDFYVFDDQPTCEAIIAKRNSEGKEVKNVRLTKEYQEWKDSEMRIISEKSVIDKPAFERIKKMKDRLFSHPYAKMLLTKGRAEVGYMGEIETQSGTINVKFKPDYIKDEKHLIVDLKTAADASIDGFTRAAADMNYHIQAAFYADLMNKIEGQNRDFTFFFIAQEKKAPFAFNLFEAGPQFIAQGRYEYEMLLQMYKYCLDNNIWPGYQIFCQNKYGIIELKLPPYAIKDLTYYNHLPKNHEQKITVYSGAEV